MKKAHPGYSPGQIKAAVINTAGSDVYTGTRRTGHRYGPARVGAGRVNAYRAAHTKVLAYVTGADNPVSVSFGPVEAPINRAKVVRHRTITIANNGKRGARMRLRYDPVITQPGVSYTLSRRSIWVPAHRKRAVLVAMTIVPGQLRHTIDPTMEKEQLGYLRQYLPDASGHVLVKPGKRWPLRVPVYGAAKPVSTTRATAHDGQILLTGRGVNQGGGPTAYRSFVSVLELGATSGALPVCTSVQLSGCVEGPTTRGGDLRYVGAGSNDDYLWFGIATYGNWAALGNRLIPYVDFDVDGDGEPDYETSLMTVLTTRGENSDLLWAQTIDLHANGNPIVDLEPVNFNDGDVDTNVFDSNVALLPVWRDWAGLGGAGDLPIGYTVGVFDTFSGQDIDTADVERYDVGAPALKVDGPLYLDTGGTAIAFQAAGKVDALVLHLHGATGSRAEVVGTTGGLMARPSGAASASTKAKPQRAPSTGPSEQPSSSGTATPSPNPSASVSATATPTR